MAPTALNYDQLVDKLRGELGGDIEKALEKNLVPLRDVIRGLEDRARGLENQTTRFAEHVLATGTSPDAPKGSKGLGIARLVRALAACKGDSTRAIDWLRRTYGKDDIAAKALETSENAKTKLQQLAVEFKAPQLASDHETGGVFVTPEFSQDLIENLRPMSVVQSLNPMFVPLNGSLTFPKVTGSTTASYIGEAAAIPKTGITTGQLRLTPKKLSALVPISNDLLRQNDIAADTVVRDDLSLSLALRGDLAKIRGTGTQHSPRGMRYWVAAGNVVDCSQTEFGADATPTLAELNNTFEQMVYLLEAANVPMVRPGFIWHPRTTKVLRGARDLDGRYVYRDEIQRGMFYNFPFRQTTQIPINLGGSSDESEIYLADFAQLLDAEQQGLIIDASREASYVEGSVTRSAFQNDETIVRALLLHDFGSRYDEAISVATGVKWTTAPVG
jgi:HK97 family phage major capsid protein